jgi:hypothetical protein
MELNGVANITILINKLEDDLEHSTLTNPEYEEVKTAINGIKEQLDLLNRYMIAYSDNKRNTMDNLLHGKATHIEAEPAWHEVRENPSKYPTLREKIASFQNEIAVKNT